MLINPDLHFTLSIASCILRPTSLISFSTIFFQVFFGLQVPTCPGIFSSVHFLIHSPSCFSTRPSHLNLLFLNTDCMSSNPNLCLSSLLGTLSINLVPTIHLTIFISFLSNFISFSRLSAQVSLPYNIQLLMHASYTFPLSKIEITFAVRKLANCLKLFQPLRILAVTA